MKTMMPQRLAALAALAASLALAAPMAQAQTETWQAAGVDSFTLNQPEGSRTAFYRTQGIAVSGDEWIFSWQYGLERTDLAFNTLQRNSSLTRPFELGIPKELRRQGLNHIGDIDVANGVIYASLDSTDGYTNGHVALYSAADLHYLGTALPLVGAPDNPHHDVASWVAVNGAAGLGYGKEWQDGSTVNLYHLDDWSFAGTLQMDRTLGRIQGGKVFGNALYLSSDNDTHSVYRVDLASGHVDELFQLPHPAGDLETEGIAIRALAGGGAEMRVEMIVAPGGLDAYRVDLVRYTLAVPEAPTALLLAAGLSALLIMRRSTRD